MLFIPYDSFENLDEAKKQTIINAGYKVFADYGYEKASVEDITKEAGISKGSLFYYFVNKKNFYVYLYEYCGALMEKLVDCPGANGKPTYIVYTDFFERLNAIQLLKMKANSEYPYMARFAKKSILDTSAVIRGEISKINERYTKERAMMFFQDLDYSKFKDGIEPMMVIQLLVWCSEGCVNQSLLENALQPSSSTAEADFQRVVEMYNKYVQMFRKNFYKDEYL